MGTFGMAYWWRESVDTLVDTDAWPALGGVAIAHGIAGVAWMSRQPRATQTTQRLAFAAKAHLTFYTLLLLSFVSLLAAVVGLSEDRLAWATAAAVWYVCFGSLLFFGWRIGLARIEAWSTSHSADQMVEDLVTEPLDYGLVGTALALLLASVSVLPSASDHNRSFAEGALRSSFWIPSLSIALAVYGYVWGRCLHRAPTFGKLVTLLKARTLIGGVGLLLVGYLFLLLWLDVARIPIVGIPLMFWALSVPMVLVVMRVQDEKVRWARLAGDSVAWVGAMVACEFAPSPFRIYVTAGVAGLGLVALIRRQFK